MWRFLKEFIQILQNIFYILFLFNKKKGIFGYFQLTIGGNLLIENCYSKSNIEAKGNPSNSGGLIGLFF